MRPLYSQRTHTTSNRHRRGSNPPITQHCIPFQYLYITHLQSKSSMMMGIHPGSLLRMLMCLERLRQTHSLHRSKYLELLGFGERRFTVYVPTSLPYYYLSPLQAANDRFMKHQRFRYLDELIALEGKQHVRGDLCRLCPPDREKRGLIMYRCKTCVMCPQTCKECMAELHKFQPFCNIQVYFIIAIPLIYTELDYVT
jgi:hypothetical protein